MNATTEAKFTGFEGVTENGTPVWVMNEGTMNDGVTPAWKVKLGKVDGYDGWSGFVKPVIRYRGSIGMIRKDSVKRGRWGSRDRSR